MTDLSPAARAVLTAVTLKKYDVPLNNALLTEGLPDFAEEMAPLIAAALRVAVEQVVPEQGCQIYGLTQREDERQQVRDQLLAIAAELEAQP